MASATEMDERSAGFDKLRQNVYDYPFGYFNYDDEMVQRDRNSKAWTEEEREKAMAFVDRLKNNTSLSVPTLVFVRDLHEYDLPYLLFKWANIEVTYKCKGKIETIKRWPGFDFDALAIHFRD